MEGGGLNHFASKMKIIIIFYLNLLKKKTLSLMLGRQHLIQRNEL